MKIIVYRQACFSKDDQAGPLEAEYSVESDTTFSSLVQEIITSRFLQFSSTHNRITGEVDGKEMVEVFSPYSASMRQPEFKITPNTLAVELLGGKALSFHFRHV